MFTLHICTIQAHQIMEMGFIKGSKGCIPNFFTNKSYTKLILFDKLEYIWLSF